MQIIIVLLVMNTGNALWRVMDKHVIYVSHLINDFLPEHDMNMAMTHYTNTGNASIKDKLSPHFIYYLDLVILHFIFSKLFKRL